MCTVYAKTQLTVKHTEYIVTVQQSSTLAIVYELRSRGRRDTLSWDSTTRALRLQGHTIELHNFLDTISPLSTLHKNPKVRRT